MYNPLWRRYKQIHTTFWCKSYFQHVCKGKFIKLEHFKPKYLKHEACNGEVIKVCSEETPTDLLIDMYIWVGFLVVVCHEELAETNS